jgi:hypothetical protein
MKNKVYKVSLSFGRVDRSFSTSPIVNYTIVAISKEEAENEAMKKWLCIPDPKYSECSNIFVLKTTNVPITPIYRGLMNYFEVR